MLPVFEYEAASGVVTETLAVSGPFIAEHVGNHVTFVI